MGQREMQHWGILKKDFNNITDSDMQESSGKDDLVDSSYESEADSGEEEKGCSTAHNKSWVTGKRVASDLCSTLSSVSGYRSAASLEHQKMKDHLLRKFPDIFTDKLGP